MLTLTIEHSDGSRSITIHAETMKELIDSKLPEWLPKYEKDLSLLKKTKGYKLYKNSFLESEKKSGWYYDC
jgi:hypothetical protein